MEEHSSTCVCETPDEDKRFFCLTCQKRICDECVIGKCSTHSKEIYGKSKLTSKRQNIVQKLEDIKTGIPKRKQRIETLRGNSDTMKEEMTKVKDRTESLKRIITTIQEDDLKELKEAQQKTDACLEEENKILDDIERLIEQSSNIANLQQEEIDEMEKKIQIISEDTSPDIPARLVFSFAKENNEESRLRLLVGSIDNCNYEIMTFNDKTDDKSDDSDHDYLIPAPRLQSPEKPYERKLNITLKEEHVFKLNITAMHIAIAKKTVFIENDSVISEMKNHEELIERKILSSAVNGLVALDADRLLVSQQTGGISVVSRKHKHIWSIGEKSFHVTPLTDLEPFLPVCMCLSNTREVTVGLQSSTNKKEFKFQKYILQKDKLETINLDLSENFSFPTHIIQQADGRICIIDRTEDTTAQLVCLAENGNVLFRYPKDEKIKRNFVGMCTCKNGIIALIDACVVSGLHFLDVDGNCLSMERKKLKPCSIANDGGDNLWIGYEGGTIEVISALIG